MLAVILSAAKKLLSNLIAKEGRWILMIAGLLVCSIFVLMCHRPTPAPLPSPVAKAIARQQVEGAVDSIETSRLKVSSESVQVKEVMEAARATRAADSGNFRGAYALEDTALLDLDREGELLGLALTRSEGRAERTDSVLADVLPLLASREPPCRFALFIPCPSRRAVAVATAILTGAAFVAVPRLVRP